MTGPATGGDKLTWPPLLPLTENTHAGGDWQMDRSDPEDSNAGSQSGQNVLPSCEVFGANDTFSMTGWGGGKVSKDGDYLFTLWRPYTCCEIKGASLLFQVDFMPYPPPAASP